MKKKRDLILGRFLPLVFFMIGTVSITCIAFVGPAGAAGLPKGLDIPLTINGGISVSPYHLSGGIQIWEPNHVQVTDALVAINGTFMKYNAQEQGYRMPVTYGNFSVVGTQYNVKIWLNDKTRPLSPQTCSQFQPDGEGTGSLQGWLTPVFPVSGSVVNLAKDPTPTFRWSIAGTVGEVCWFLNKPPDPHIFFKNCGGQLSVVLPTFTLLPDSPYQLTLTNQYEIGFRPNLIRNIKARIVILQEESIGFHTM